MCMSLASRARLDAKRAHPPLALPQPVIIMVIVEEKQPGSSLQVDNSWLTEDNFVVARDREY